MGSALAIFLPLLSAGLVGIFGRRMGDTISSWLATTLLVTAAISGCHVFWDVAIQGRAFSVDLWDWLATPSLQIGFSLYFDSLSAIMIFVVTSISAMVHMYSIGYMHHDAAVPRFMAYLGLFTFFMLILVTAKNLLQLFLGWEGVGLASYLLIGFWFEKPSANKAAMKAFLVNRIGDLSLMLGLLLIYLITGTLDFQEIFGKMEKILAITWYCGSWEISAVTAISLLFLGAAMGKSAQLGLHVWLPDAMEGPTPVSALIHAATMVTAGIFLMLRVSPLIVHSQTTLSAMCIVGGATLLFAGTVALTQNDIKRIIAYSTCSQLGYMVLAMGISAFQAAIFHLYTHAFFKALLFLGAGSVIHALSGEQNVQAMGGMRQRIPLTYTMMAIGTLALTGAPFLSGYYSKDWILEAGYLQGGPFGLVAFWVGIAGAVLTACYSWRLLFLTFHGKTRADEKIVARVHESPWVMCVPLLFLALGAICAGKISYPLFAQSKTFEGIIPASVLAQPLKHVPETLGDMLIHWMPVIAGVVGFAIAGFLYLGTPKAITVLVRRFSALYRFFLNKWFFDELYEALIIKPLWKLGEFLWQRGDTRGIDLCLPKGAAYGVGRSSLFLSRLQTGYLAQYAMVMILGVLGFTFFYMMKKIIGYA